VDARQGSHPSGAPGSAESRYRTGIGAVGAVYFPIYVAGGHNSSTSANLIGLFGGYLTDSFALPYWIALHGILAALYAGQFFAEGSQQILLAERWRKPVLQVSAIALVCAVVFTNYDKVVCRPLAELGNNAAQVCVAKSNSVEARYWYERAAADGHAEAIAWLVDNTPNRQKRLAWLQKGAAAGDAAVQYQLAEHLRRYGGPAAQADAERWLEAAAEGNHGPAQLELAEQLTAKAIRTQSHELLARRNKLLEQAAASGSRLAMLRLAQHYSRGSMGYPVSMTHARYYYQALADGGEPTRQESRLQISAATYASRLQELDAWQAGLDAGDPQVIKTLAKLYLKSQLPGPGVRELGTRLFTQVAETDASARRELIVMLRTGTDGAEKDLAGAREWLLKAAEAGEADAMDRVASNYMNGREGFPVDYPKSRFWIEALIKHYQQDDSKDALARIASLENHLKYFDRLGDIAGGTLLGQADLQNLAQKTDAEAHYQYAQQLLSGHGAARRAEALSRLNAAAELGHGEASWRLVGIYERGFAQEIDPTAARRELKRAMRHHHFNATRELASRYEYGKKGFVQDLPKAIAMYEAALTSGRDNRYEWNLDPDNYNHYRWLESRLRQARLKLNAQVAAATTQPPPPP